MAENAINGVTPHNQEKPVILIADDSRVVRTSLKNILKNDCHLIEAKDGLQAWEALLEAPDVRLIFSDLSMPQLDGRGLLKKIRESEINRIRNLPFIVVTGNEPDLELRQSLQDTGATELITKPFDPASIISVVSTLVARQEEESYFILGEVQDQTEFLPGVANQSQFMELASKELSFAIRNKNELAAALLKIDQFSHISEHYSEPAVEHILLSMVEIIRRHIHPDDTMAYFGEGLFAILRPASNAIGTRYIGRRILEDFKAKQFYLGESDKTISASIGISAPEIKHGSRLRELLLLAEGRLKAAMDLGGGRVIDKGNDTLTPVDGPRDSSLTYATQPSVEISSYPSPTRSMEPSSSGGIMARSDTNTRETTREVAEMRGMLERLAKENQSLREEVERWRRQSGESEQLRHRIFELESEQQQMHVKLGGLQAENRHFHRLSEQAETKLQELLHSEEERTATLKQTNQIYTEENLRLEGQLKALDKRARTAESANRKSEQLVVSLKDNIALLRTRLEQTQTQLAEAGQPSPGTAESAPPPQTRERAPETEPEERLDEVTGNLVFDGFPSQITAPCRRPLVAKSFPEGDSPKPKPDKPGTPQQRFTPPVYRPEEDRPAPKPRRPLSALAIASVIMLLLLALIGSFLFNYLERDGLTTIARVAPLNEGGLQSLASGHSAQTANPQRTAPAPGTSPEFNLPDGAKLQAELTLRQMAEETFNQQLHQLGPVDPPHGATAPTGLLGPSPAAGTSNAMPGWSMPENDAASSPPPLPSQSLPEE